MRTQDEIVALYLDYVNNFLTVTRFAEYHNISEQEAELIINAGRVLNQGNTLYA